MWAALASVVDVVHALAMVTWVVGLPLLFFRRHPRLRRAFASYAIAFAVLSQLSFLLLGECFMTTLARMAAERGGEPVSTEWFTTRLSRTVFGMAPSHRAISRMTEALIVVTAIGVLVSLRRTTARRLNGGAHAGASSPKEAQADRFRRDAGASCAAAGGAGTVERPPERGRGDAGAAAERPRARRAGAAAR